MGKRIAARVDGLQRTQLARNMHRRTNAVQVVVTNDLRQQLDGHERDHRPRPPAFLLESQLENVRLLLGNVLVEQLLVLLEIADSNGNAIAVAARVGNQVAGSEDTRREYAAGALIGTKRQDVLRAVADVDHGGDAGVKKARERLESLLPIGRSRFGVRRGTRVEAPAQMDVHVHQSRNEIFAAAVDAVTFQVVGESAGRNGSDVFALDRYGHVGLRRMRAVDERHVLDDYAVCARGAKLKQEGDCSGREQKVLFHVGPP